MRQRDLIPFFAMAFLICFGWRGLALPLLQRRMAPYGPACCGAWSGESGICRPSC